MGEKHSEQDCYFLSNREAFKQELIVEIRKQNEQQDKITSEFQRDITQRFSKMEKRIESVEKEVQEGFHDLNNGWKKDLINQLVASLSGYKSTKQKIWLEVIKVLGILAGSSGIVWILISKLGGA